MNNPASSDKAVFIYPEAGNPKRWRAGGPRPVEKPDLNGSGFFLGSICCRVGPWEVVKTLCHGHEGRSYLKS
jgi:hypothetical protein